MDKEANTVLLNDNDHTYHTTYLFQCPTCDKRYKTATACERHKQSHMTGGKDKLKYKYKCRKCKKTFRTETTLNCHNIVNHNMESRYHCKLCKMFWICDSMYTQHMKTHCGLKQLLNCRHCERVFKNAGKFAVHQALHFERKPRYSCKICSKEFTNLSVSLGHNCRRFHLLTVPLQNEGQLPLLVDIPMIKHEPPESYAASGQLYCPDKLVKQAKHVTRSRPMKGKTARKTKTTNKVKPKDVSSSMEGLKQEEFDGWVKANTSICTYIRNDVSSSMEGLKQEDLDGWVKANTCDRCGHVSNNPDKHAIHVKKCHRCGKCGRNFIKESNYRVHMETDCGGNIKCLKCSKVFTRIKGLLHHKTHSESCGVPGLIKKRDRKNWHLVCERCGQVSNSPYRHARHAVRCDRHHKCDKCSEIFIRKTRFRVHVETNCGTNLECIKCSNAFTSITGLVNHMKHSVSCGELKKNYKCDLCTRTFATEWGFLAHQGSDACKTFPCPVCNKVFWRSLILDRHMISHTKVRNYKCEKCDRTFLQRGHLNEHYRSNAACGEGANLPEQRLQPSGAPTVIKTYICDVCGKTFRKKYEFKCHMKTHTGECVCKKCGKEFADWKGMKKHRSSFCMGDRECDVCGQKAFSNRMDFFRHMQKHDPLFKFRDVGNWNSADYQCHKCGFACTRPSCLKDHIVHTCAAGFMCEQCGMTNFTNKMEYRKHMYFHDSEYHIEREVIDAYPKHKFTPDHMCTICFKTFNTVPAKLKHPCLRSGLEKVGRFECDMCDDVLTTKDKLRHHRNRVHAVKIPCEFCGKEFIASTLKQHKRTHTGETPYECRQCGRKFKTNSHLKYHNNRQGCG